MNNLACIRSIAWSPIVHVLYMLVHNAKGLHFGGIINHVGIKKNYLNKVVCDTALNKPGINNGFFSQKMHPMF